MPKNMIKFLRKRPKTLLQRELNRRTGEYDCVTREGGRIIKREPLPERDETLYPIKKKH